jgi:hypothetical protein
MKNLQGRVRISYGGKIRELQSMNRCDSDTDSHSQDERRWAALENTNSGAALLRYQKLQQWTFGTAYTTSVLGQSISIVQTLGMVLGQYLSE